MPFEYLRRRELEYSYAGILAGSNYLCAGDYPLSDPIHSFIETHRHPPSRQFVVFPEGLYRNLLRRVCMPINLFFSLQANLANIFLV